jgi:RNA polymerase sigma-70 factor (ECF subfamily)
MRTMGEAPRRPLDDVLAAALPRLRCFVARRIGRALGGRESPSDIVQSVCRSIVEDGAAGDLASADLRRRLFRRARHKLVDSARRHHADRRSVDREQPLAQQDVSNDDADPARIVERSDLLARLGAAIDALPPLDREVVVLSSLLDVPHSEIARHLGTTESATRTRLCRALARLGLDFETDR